MMGYVHVYLLFDTVSPEHWRYVGVSKNPDRRLRDHIKESLEGSSRAAHKGAWIRSVLTSGSTIRARVIESYAEAELAYIAEQFWIKHLREAGHRLTNVTIGGEGFRGNPWNNPALREKLLAAHAAYRETDEFKELVTEHWQSYWSDPDHREEQSVRTKAWWDAHPERRRTVEHADPDVTRELISANMKRIWADEHQRAARIQSIRDSGSLARSAETNRKLWADPDYKARRSMNIALGRRRAKAERNGWILEQA